MKQRVFGKKIFSAILIVIFVVVMAISLTGCINTRKVVAEKIAKGEKLTDKEAKYYEKHKKKIDTIVEKFKKEMPVAMTAVLGESQKKGEGITYKTNEGQEVEFDVSREAHIPFGFFHGDRVRTPNGDATVVGVRDGELWFHVDEETGGSYWDGYKKEEFKNKGFVLLQAAPAKEQAAVSGGSPSAATGDERKKEEMTSEETNKREAQKVANGAPPKTFIPQVAPIENLQ